MPHKDSFRLEPILNLKASMVDNLEIEFANLKKSHQNELNNLQRLERIKDQHLNDLHSQQHGTLDCQSIQLRQQYLRALDAQMIRQRFRVEEVRRQIEIKRDELVKTMQDRKSLEKLREHFQTNLHQDLRRREVRAVDDIVISKYGRER